MFTFHDLHWIAAVLNSHTRMLKMATELERAHAYPLVRAEITKLIEIDQNNGNPSLPPKVTTNVPSPPSKKFKSYTTQFYDDTDLDEASDNTTAAKRAHRELEMYLHMNIAKYTASSNDSDNPLLFWKGQKDILPTMSKLAKQIVCIPASSTTVERAFSSTGIIISQRRTNINPSIVNDILLIRSATAFTMTKT